jgi:hypothetical protein
VIVVDLVVLEKRYALYQTRNIVSNHIVRTDRTDRIDCIVHIDCIVRIGHIHRIGHIAHSRHMHLQNIHYPQAVENSVLLDVRTVILEHCLMVVIVLLFGCVVVVVVVLNYLLLTEVGEEGQVAMVDLLEAVVVEYHIVHVDIHKPRF